VLAGPERPDGKFPVRECRRADIHYIYFAVFQNLLKAGDGCSVFFGDRLRPAFDWIDYPEGISFIDGPVGPRMDFPIIPDPSIAIECKPYLPGFSVMSSQLFEEYRLHGIRGTEI